MSAEVPGLWQFAVSFYSQPKVAPLCLELQNRYGLAVNRVLFCLWLARQQQGLDVELFSDAELQDWHFQVLIPLRQLRYRVRGQAAEDSRLDGAYQQLKASELACEKTELQMLEDLATANGLCPVTDLAYRPLAEANLRTYLSSLSVGWPAELQQILELSCQEAV